MSVIDTINRNVYRLVAPIDKIASCDVEIARIRRSVRWKRVITTTILFLVLGAVARSARAPASSPGGPGAATVVTLQEQTADLTD